MKQVFTILLWLALLPVTVGAQSGEAALADEYFRDGEYEPALELYTRLQRSDDHNRHYILRIADCYKQLARYEDGMDFLEKVIRKESAPFIYQFTLAELMRLTGNTEGATALETEVIENGLQIEADYIEAGGWLIQHNRSDAALDSYLFGRKKLRSKYMFAGEIAGLYAIKGEFGPATEEYLNLYRYNPGYSSSLNINILSMVRPESKDAIETVLLSEIQKLPGDKPLRNLVYEFYVLTEDFREAFVQVKSIDKVFGSNGQEVFQFAMTMRNNKNFAMSNKALDYIIETNTQSAFFFRAYEAKTVNSEMVAFESIPVDTADIRAAVVAYDELLDRFGRQARFYDAQYRKANLLAFYLFEPEEALAEINRVEEIPVTPQQRAEALLLAGDIYLMQKEFKKARMQYEKVMGMFPEGQIGAEAKFRDGRLSYFEGDFEIAQARLKSIKDNTTNDISNDAIRLFLLIQDNTGLDSTTTALEYFADAQMRIFQHDYAPAERILDTILVQFPEHSLADEIFWEKANMRLMQNNTEEALSLLDRILQNYPEDILGDDALFTKARIYDRNLGNKEEAMSLYIQFLRQYPGSLFIVQVRKRIRELRAERS